jgi:hypothetical protein
MHIARRSHYRLAAYVAVAGGLVLAACTGGASVPSETGPPPSEGGTELDASSRGEGGSNDAGVVVRAATLTVSLDPSIDQADDDVRADAISAAIMLDKQGATTTTASVVTGGAVFDLSAVAPGDYFIEINGDAKDLIPTRIDDPSAALTQRIGKKLRASYMGPAASPTYRINAYTDGPVIGFFEGAPVPGEAAYALYSFASSKLELDLLGTARPLTSMALSRCVGHPNVPADAWLLNTKDQEHHGDTYNADGGPANCASCHTDYWNKPPSYSDITLTRSWCFRCHLGVSGAGAGLVDPTH